MSSTLGTGQRTTSCHYRDCTCTTRHSAHRLRPPFHFELAHLPNGFERRANEFNFDSHVLLLLWVSDPTILLYHTGVNFSTPCVLGVLSDAEEARKRKDNPLRTTPDFSVWRVFLLVPIEICSCWNFWYQPLMMLMEP